MTRLASLLVAVVAVAGLGCSKPSEADCRKALANMQHLMGTDNLREDGRIESEVRRCKGGSKKKAVQCAIKAQTLDDLRHCDFYKVPANALGVGTGGSGSGTVVPSAGSGSPATGSGSAGAAAGSGSAAAGSAAGPGSASGSAAPGGSAASSGAAAGSAASAGSAVGSAK